MYGSSDSDSVCGDSSGLGWVRDTFSHQTIHWPIHSPVLLPTHRSIYHFIHPSTDRFIFFINQSIDWSIHSRSNHPSDDPFIHPYTRLSTDPFTHTPITDRFMHSFIHPSTERSIRPPTHSPTDLGTIHTFIHPPIDRLIHSVIIHRSVHSFMYSLTHRSIHSFIFIHSPICGSIHSLVRQLFIDRHIHPSSHSPIDIHSSLHPPFSIDPFMTFTIHRSIHSFMYPPHQSMYSFILFDSPKHSSVDPFIYPLIHRLIHSFIHQLSIDRFIHQPFIDRFTNSFIHQLIHWSIHAPPSTHPSIVLFIHSPTQRSIHSFIHHLSTYQFIHPPICGSIHSLIQESILIHSSYFLRDHKWRFMYFIDESANQYIQTVIGVWDTNKNLLHDGHNACVLVLFRTRKFPRGTRLGSFVSQSDCVKPPWILIGPIRNSRQLSWWRPCFCSKNCCVSRQLSWWVDVQIESG